MNSTGGSDEIPGWNIDNQIKGGTQMSKTVADFAFRSELALPYEEAVEHVIAALKEEGFGVLTEVDVQATLKQKLDADFRKYTILGACNPSLAQKALQEELEIGLLLPCNVIVYESDGGSVVSIVDPISILGMVENPDLEPIANDARSRLRRVSEALSN
jgi:uncharacterized protein (DUF302 family)